MAARADAQGEIQTCSGCESVFGNGFGHIGNDQAALIPKLPLIRIPAGVVALRERLLHGSTKRLVGRQLKIDLFPVHDEREVELHRRVISHVRPHSKSRVSRESLASAASA